MNFKHCNACNKLLPDTPEYFAPRLKAGGIWGTMARCKKCNNRMIGERRTAKKIIAKAKELGYTVTNDGRIENNASS